MAGITWNVGERTPFDREFWKPENQRFAAQIKALSLSIMRTSILIED